MSESGTLERLLLLAGEALQDLSARLQPDVFADYLSEFGIILPPGTVSGPLAGPLAAVDNAAKKIAPLVGPLREVIDAAGGANAAAVIVAGAAVANEIAATAAALRVLAGNFAQAASGITDPVARARLEMFATELPSRLLGRLLLERLDEFSVQAAPLLAIAGLLDDRMDQGVRGDPNQPAYYLRRIHFDRIGKLATDPTAYLRDVFGWGTPNFDAFALLERVKWWFWSRKERIYWIGEIDLDPPETDGLDFAGFRVMKDVTQAPPGLATELRFSLSEDINREVNLGDSNWTAFVESKCRFEEGLRATLAPNGQLTVSPIGAPAISGRVGLRLKNEAGTAMPLIGITGGSRLEARVVEVSVTIDGLTSEPVVRITTEGMNLVLDLRGGGDSFLSSVLPPDGLNAEVPLAISWSTRKGLQFSGSTGLEARWSLSSRIGPVTLNAVNIGISPEDDRLGAHVSLSGSVTLGPIAVHIDRVGLEAVLDFSETGGNLGIADLDLHFKPPQGVGLGIKAAMVEGGGFLSFDPQQGQYSGYLELKIAERISVKGFGLLSTRLPGGGKGYSLVIIIFVEDFKPIPLGLGFNLTGIGGLLALNRTFDEAALRTGLKQHALDSVMFPRDPSRNAPQIISNLNRVFPPATGHHLFGPMVQISWGTPALITAEVALVLEFGARRRLLLLAQVVSILPRRENDLVRIQMDAIGVVDFDQGKAALDATLYDSRLLQKFALTGDMAMRLQWESSPNFALAVGGLHPAFNPPPEFPKLERIAVNLSAGDNPRLRCEAYYALTSNTVQFGARAELYASAAGFSVHGDIGYDVLIQFDPFFFLAGFHAQLQLKRGSTNLFKVRLEGSLAGPRPLHLKGKATFEIFWWDVTIRINTTLVSGEKPPPPAPVEVLPRLREALAQPGNWTAKLPAGSRSLVQLRGDAGATTDILLHPLGTLTIKQGVVPLNMDISRFGQAAPAGPRRFTITNVDLGGKDQTTTPVKDFFAPAQFIELTDDQKLSRPSFEEMEAGISFGSDAVTFTADITDRLEVKTVEFETWILDSENGEARRSEAEKPQPQQPPVFYQLSRALLLQQAKFGAAGSSELRHTGRAKYRSTKIGKYQVTKEGWSIVTTDDLTQQPVSKPANYSTAVESLRKVAEENPLQAAEFKILRLSEINKS